MSFGRAGVGGIYEGLDRLDPTVDKTSGGSVTRTVTYYPAAGATLAPHFVWRSAGAYQQHAVLHAQRSPGLSQRHH
ncbi:MAG: hypothetical protein ABIU06_02800 [Anaerolineales bacterium]